MEIVNRKRAFIEVMLDGERAPIPKRLWETYFNPDLDPFNFHLKLYGGRRKFRIGMMGADGAGSYAVIWTYVHHRWMRNRSLNVYKDLKVMERIFGPMRIWKIPSPSVRSSWSGPSSRLAKCD